MLQLSMSAQYHPKSDHIEVSLYKHESGVPHPITAGVLYLKQAGEEIQKISIDKTAQSICFYHPKYAQNLTLLADVDSLTLEIQVKHASTQELPVTFTQPLPDAPIQDVVQAAEDEFVPHIHTDVSVKTPVILDLDFSDEVVPVAYAGGNRIIFDDNNQLVTQPLDTMIDAPKLIEVGAVNLLSGITQDHFTYTYPYSAANFQMAQDFGYPSLRLRCLGGAQGNYRTTSLTYGLIAPIANGRTLQMFFGVNKAPTPKTFRFITERLDSAGAVLEQDIQTLQFSDFVGQISMIASTMSQSGLLTFRFEIPDLHIADTFNIEMVLPQITGLDHVSSYTPTTRAADIYRIDDIELDYDLSTIEMSMAVGEDRPCYLFDLGTVKAFYTGTALTFAVGLHSVSVGISLKEYQNYSFTFDKEADLLSITVDDVLVASGGDGFSVSDNGPLFIGCDANGTLQLGGRILRFGILR